MKDEELAELGRKSHLQGTKPPRFTWKGFIFFLGAMAAIYLIGAFLTPGLPDEIIVMTIYVILYLVGFDPTKWLKIK